MFKKGKKKGGGGMKRTGSDAKPVAPAPDAAVRESTLQRTGSDAKPVAPATKAEALESTFSNLRIPPATPSPLESPGSPPQWDKESMEPLKVVVEKGSK